MRTLAMSLAAVLVASCAHVVERPGDGAARSRDVAAATAAWVAAYNTRDPARITALYDPEAVLWGTTSPTIRRGPAAVADYFKDAAKRPDARVAIADQNVRVIGDVAINSGSYSFTDFREGKNVTSPARFTFVFRYRDGRWLIADHHSSRTPN